eukprot:1439555-Ditylum_brightwellii.AAC.1
MKYKMSAQLGAAPTLMHSSLMWHMMPSSKQPYTTTAAKNGFISRQHKKWANFCMHFIGQHRYFHEMQASAAQVNFSANNVYYDQGTPVAPTTSTTSYVQNQTAEVLAKLAVATEEDRSMVSNLTDTNLHLMEQVANMTGQMTQKDSEIAELHKSIQELNLKICAFATMNTPRNLPTTSGRGGRGNSGRGGRGQQTFTVKYCWTCRVQMYHHGKNCSNKAEGHRDDATLDNCMGGSEKGNLR